MVAVKPVALAFLVRFGVRAATGGLAVRGVVVPAPRFVFAAVAAPFAAFAVSGGSSHVHL